jgi:hypothetical protein
MLQIKTLSAIQYWKLEGRACFIEYDEEINDVIYSGPVIFVMNWNQNKLHYLQVLATFKELEILASKYDYIMVIDNKR